MFRKAIFGIMLILLLIGMLFSPINMKPARSTWTGTVYIRADGSIDPPNAPIITYDNVTYTLTDNITSSGDGIVVERDNIMIEGAEYTVEGTETWGSKGIDLSRRANVTIENIRIKNFHYGILLNFSSGNSICRNNVKNNWYGIRLDSSTNNSLIRNNCDDIYLDSSINNSLIGNNLKNIFLRGSSNNTIIGNIFVSGGLFVRDSFENVVVDNFVNGKPLVYLEGVSNYIIENAGQVVLIDCKNILLKNLNLSHTNVGVQLWRTSNTEIRGNNITNNRCGIYLSYSSNNTIDGNNITNNYCGVSYYSSNDTKIFVNEITKNWYGIHLYSSSNNSIYGNNITNNGHGIYLSYSSNNSLIGNNLKNRIYGIVLEDSSNCNSIIGNKITGNYYSGIVFDNSSGNVIYGNNITNNYWNGIGLSLSSSSNNSIYGNTIANNSFGIGLSSNNLICGNTIANNEYGIYLSYVSNNVIYGNEITNNHCGAYLYDSSDNVIYGNNIVANNEYGIYLYYHSSYNKIYNNNFISNKAQVYVTEDCQNIWDNDYPSGGNYWSDYTGADLFRGPYQDQYGSDGIGDTPYMIDSENRDNYPLMYPYGSPPPPYYNLTITTTIGGATEPPKGTYMYANSTTVPVTAFPDIGYSFNYWLLDGKVKTENPITITMDSNHTLEAYFIDDIPPEISEPIQDPPPDNVEPFQNVTVWVNVTDYGSGIKNVTLWYSLDNGTSWTVINMTEHTVLDMTVTCMAIIPGYENCTCVIYKIVAYDNAGNVGIENNEGYHYRYHVLTLITAKITISPHLLNPKSNEMWITAYIELPQGYNVSDIDVSTIMLNGAIPVDLSAPIAIGDFDNDTVPDLMVCFNWTDVADYILSKGIVFGNITLEVSGRLFDGTIFTGTDTILVSSLIGDVNVDGKVDIKDIYMAATAFGSYPGHPRYNPNTDFTKDGKIDIQDIYLTAKNFGKHA